MTMMGTKAMLRPLPKPPGSIALHPVLAAAQEVFEIGRPLAPGRGPGSPRRRRRSTAQGAATAGLWFFQGISGRLGFR